MFFCEFFDIMGSDSKDIVLLFASCVEVENIFEGLKFFG